MPIERNYRNASHLSDLSVEYYRMERKLSALQEELTLLNDRAKAAIPEDQIMRHHWRAARERFTDNYAVGRVIHKMPCSLSPDDLRTTSEMLASLSTQTDPHNDRVS